MWWTFVVAMAWAGDPAPEVVCPEAPLDAVVDAALTVEQSWLQLDGPGFDVARNRLGRLMPCIDTPMRPTDALVVHRSRALIAFVDGDVEASHRAFAAVHALDPEWTPPADLVPEEHPLWSVFRTAVDDDEDPKMVPFRSLPDGGWLVDGTRYPDADGPVDAAGVSTAEYGLPADRAFVLQILGRGERVTYSGYHFSTADVPVQDILAPGGLTRKRLKRRRDARIATTVTGVAALAGGGALFALGWQERQGLVDGEVPLDEAEQVAGQANAYGAGAYSLAGVGALTVALGWSIPW